MKLVILGASGLVGWNLWQVSKQHGYLATGTFNSHQMPGLVRLSLIDRNAVERYLRAETPDAVICCTAWSWVDGCQSDPKRAFQQNSELPANAARAAGEIGARFIHFSTSYVFDGSAGPYTEEDPPNPISIYAESKLSGEIAVTAATGGKALIIRTMGVYGDDPQRKNFVDQVRRNLSAGARMKVPSDQIGNATEAANLAEGVFALLECGASGIWNVAGPVPNLARAEFARQIACTYGLDASLFDFVPTAELKQPAPRPLHAGLITSKTTAATGWRPRGWPSGAPAETAGV